MTSGTSAASLETHPAGRSVRTPLPAPQPVLQQVLWRPAYPATPPGRHPPARCDCGRFPWPCRAPVGRRHHDQDVGARLAARHADAHGGVDAWPAMVTAAVSKAARTRSAATAASLTELGRMATNSSPPSRPTMSDARMLAAPPSRTASAPRRRSHGRSDR